MTTEVVKKKAGRPPGSANKRSRKIAEEVYETGISPLEVLIEAMRFEYGEATNPENQDIMYKSLKLEKAADYAAKAAPYMHPRLQAVELSTDPDSPIEHRHILTDELVKQKMIELNERY